jgi:hypothetical protein
VAARPDKPAITPSQPSSRPVETPPASAPIRETW